MLTYELATNRIAALTEASVRIARREADLRRRRGTYGRPGYDAARARLQEARDLWVSLLKA